MPRRRGNKWQADVVLPNGRRVRPSFKTREEAEAFESNPSYKGSKNTVGELFMDAYELYWRNGANARTQYSNINQLIEFFGANSNPSVITTSRVRDFIREMRAKGNTDATLSRKTCTLRKLCTYLYTENKLSVMPQIDTFGPGEQRMKEYTPEEERALLSHLRPLHREFCTFLLYTGCRVSEARRVRWVDLTDNTVTFWKTKTKKPRTVPLHPKAKAAVEWVKAQGPNYIVWDIDYRELHYDWNRARDIVGLKNDPDAVIHALRHTCLSRLARGGMDLLRIGTWAGHSDTKTTKRYIHLMPSDLFVGVTLLDGTSANAVSGTENAGVKLVSAQEVA